MSYLGWKSYPVSRLNGDKASKLVLKDMVQWGVKTEGATAKPGSNTPIIVQRIRHDAKGKVSHRFSWKCPNCGAWLPSYSAVPAGAAQEIAKLVKSPEVFFFDRVSRGAIDLARHYADEGSLVVFEPSGVGNPRLFQEAVECAHIIKYSEERIHETRLLPREVAPLLEIQTRGSKGLRFRRPAGGATDRKWKTVAAILTNNLKDTAGAGDWCCAGIIHKLGAAGFLGLYAATDNDICEAIRLGQALAAWNCKFTGPRGGMYASGKSAFRSAVRELLSGQDVRVDAPSLAQQPSVRLRCLSESCAKARAAGSRLSKAA
jgi:fructokinase